MGLYPTFEECGFYAHIDKADVDAIRAAVELGVTHIDTAERYASGHAEELVGEAIGTVSTGIACLSYPRWPDTILPMRT